MSAAAILDALGPVADLPRNVWHTRVCVRGAYIDSVTDLDHLARVRAAWAAQRAAAVIPDRESARLVGVTACANRAPAVS